MELLDPDVLVGNYRLIRQLGEGGMGTVYLAEHALLRRRAALKILHPMFTSREDIVERFFNEARAATTIADPGIVQVFDFGFHDDTAFIVMELLDGESLDARLRRLGKLAPSDVLRLCRQLALSLFAAHQRGVIHRDLKPENIFVVPDPEVFGGERTKILDFGIAKLTDAETSRVRTQTGLMMGTPIYMSPEQCRGAGSIDHRADVYSLGCVMFQMLAGRPPFDHEGGGELIAAHLKEIAPPVSAFVPVSATIDAIVARCIAKEAAERFATMHDLAVELDATLRSGTLPPTAPDPSRLTPVPSVSTFSAARRRARWPLAFALAVGVGLAGALVAALVIRPHESDVSVHEGTVAPTPPPAPVTTPKPIPDRAPTPPPPAPPPAPVPTVEPSTPPPMPSTPPPVIHKRHVLPPRPAPRSDAGSAEPPPRPLPSDPYDQR